MFTGRPLEWLGGIYQVQIHLTEKQNSRVILTSCGGRVKERAREGEGELGVGESGEGGGRKVFGEALVWAGDSGDLVWLPQGGHGFFAVTGDGFVQLSHHSLFPGGVMGYPLWTEQIHTMLMSPSVPQWRVCMWC